MGIFITRALLVGVVFSFLFEHPKAQTLILTLLNIIMIAYDLIKRPFLSTANMIELVCYEIIILIANISVTALAFNPDDDDLSENVTEVIIVCVFAFSIVAIIFMVYGILSGIYSAIKTARERKGKLTCMEILAIPF